MSRGGLAEPDPTASAEASFSYTFIFSRLLAERCGEVETKSLSAASDKEKQQ